MIDIYVFLERHGVEYQQHDHPAVYTCQEAAALVPSSLQGAPTKNLFLRDKKGRRHVLVSVSPEKVVDLKALAKLIGLSGVGFASAERLARYLGITPGAVSLLSVVNDQAGAVEVVVDSVLWRAEGLLCHPLVNTTTLFVAKKHLERFFLATGHTPSVLDVPSK